MLQKFPEVNYQEHPAFRGLFDSYKFDDEEVDRLVTDIDVSVEKGQGINDSQKAVGYFRNDISKNIDSLVKYVEKHIDSTIAFELFLEGIEYTKDIILKSIVRDSLKTKYNHRECNKSLLDGLNNEGMHVISISPSMKEELYRNSREHYERLKDKSKETPHLRSYENVERFSPLFKSINKMVTSSGIIDAVSEYMNTDMVLLGAGIEYSSSNHTWYKNPYPDLDNYSSEHYYLHLDEAAHLPKTLYYLSPVTKTENGATKYIKGSHSAQRSNFVVTFHKGIDRVSVDRYFKVDDTYYRPLYKIIELRKVLARFPKRLIGSSHLGDDVVENSELSNLLKENEVTFISDGSEAIVFDGGNGLHKGANVTEGERLSLQIVYKPKNEFLVERISKGYSSMGKLKILFRKMRELFL